MNLPELIEELKTRSAAEWIRDGWRRLQQLPGGSRLFDRLLGMAIPYTGALGAEVVSLSSGHARVQLRDRRGVRNHLHSIHAIALANLAELTGNLALVHSLPADGRFIVKALSIEYLKKARGVIVAECRCEPLQSSERREVELTVELTDASGAAVARAKLNTLVGPRTRGE
jgi:acyl-coenzyme A thioesterase PaaI-like protein